jgi:hypothetical protein
MFYIFDFNFNYHSAVWATDAQDALNYAKGIGVIGPMVPSAQDYRERYGKELPK